MQQSGHRMVSNHPRCFSMPLVRQAKEFFVQEKVVKPFSCYLKCYLLIIVDCAKHTVLQVKCLCDIHESPELGMGYTELVEDQHIASFELRCKRRKYKQRRAVQVGIQMHDQPFRKRSLADEA